MNQKLWDGLMEFTLQVVEDLNKIKSGEIKNTEDISGATQAVATMYGVLVPHETWKK